MGESTIVHGFPRVIAAGLAVLCFAASDASAAVQRWTFTDVVFKDARDSITGEVLGGGTLTGFFIYDTDKRQLISWNIFTSPGWATCNVPAEGNVCYVEGLHWTKGNSHVFPGAAFFALLRGDPTSDPSVMTLDFHNSIEMFTDSPIASFVPARWC